MKRFLHILVLAFLSSLAVSCYKNKPEDDTAIYGTWMLDTYTLETGASISGSDGNARTITVDFTGSGCKLVLDEDLIAAGRMGFEMEVTSYSYDPDSKRIDFARRISVADYGKSMVLQGAYDVKELSRSRLVLSQSDEQHFGKIISAKETSTYEFHHATEDDD